ncbi:nucleoside deaminase [Costertonia aggregata]|uniref:Nucleoside deaminase n=1 Tax=Costertonia aggregata TaxID=343403 RepID=A0A7H9AUT7_9FLAO|nr:nucleoside deaminase [Costertonia aggregata]
MNHEFFMQRAIALAKEGKAGSGGAFGAVIVCDGTSIVEVHNTVKSQQDCTQHAELSAIQKACQVLKSKDLSNCVLYTSCEPCMMCLGACYWAKFKTIYFGASAQDAKEHGYVYSDMFYASNTENRHREFNMVQLLREEAIAVWD